MKSMQYHDKVLTCIACKAEFLFTAGEQQFYADKGLESDPKRCKPCREERAGKLGERKRNTAAGAA